MKPVVVGVDGSACALTALNWALDYASAKSAPLLAVTVLQPSEPIGRAATSSELNRMDGVRAATQEWLVYQLDDAVRDCKSVEAHAQVREGHPVEELVDASREAAALVVGARGAGELSRLLLGSVSSGLLQHAVCPVVVVPKGARRQDPARVHSPRIVVGYDRSPSSRAALAWAVDWAHACHGGLTIVCAWEWPTFQDVPITLGRFSPDREARRIVEAAAANSGLSRDDVDTVVVKGSPAQALLEQARRGDLLVVGSRGNGGFKRLLLGSTSSHCAHHTPCPTVVVRGAAQDVAETIAG